MKLYQDLKLNAQNGNISLEMSEYVDRFGEDIPASFELGVLNGGEGLKVSVHTDFAEYLKARTAKVEMPLIQMIQSFGSVQLPTFQPFIESVRPWGFGDALIPANSDDPYWLSWDCPYPQGEFLFDDLTDQFAVSGTIRVISKLHDLYQSRTNSNRPQLFFLDPRVDIQPSGSAGSIMVDITRAMAEWVATQDETFDNPLIGDPMRKAYQHLTGMPVESFMGPRAWFRKPYRVDLLVGPDNGLSPDMDHFSRHSDTIRGYTLLPDNIGSPSMQLTLIMGIAAMHDQARKTS